MREEKKGSFFFFPFCLRKGGEILKENSHAGIYFFRVFYFSACDLKLLSYARKLHPEVDLEAGDCASHPVFFLRTVRGMNLILRGASRASPAV